MPYPVAAVRGKAFPQVYEEAEPGDLYRIPITITGSADGALVDFQIPVTLTYSANMQADFSDIRFRAADGTTLLSFWLESKTDSTTATFWVKVPAIAANPTTTTIYAYYGDAEAAGASNIRATFLIADDFNRASLNPAVAWTKHASNPLTGYGYADPGVWYENETFYIFAGSFTGGEFQGMRLFTAPLAAPQTLTDQGEILALGADTTWDDYWISDPTIVKVGSTYHMWYSGCDGTGVTGVKIGHATASAITGPWTKDGSNPVFSKASNGTNEPSVNHDGSTFHMYYTYATSGSATDVGGGGTANIGYATSADGTSWTDVGAVKTGGYQDQFQIQDDDNDLWHVFLNTDGGAGNAPMYQFTYVQPATWGTLSSNGTIQKGAGGSYDASACFAPSIVKVGDTYYMYYQAQDTTGARLALATGTSLETDLWTNTSANGYVIDTNQMYASAYTGWQVVENNTRLVAPYVVESDVKLTAGSNDIGGPVISRNSGNYIGVVLNPTANALRLYQLGAGAYIDSDTTYTIDLDTTYKIRAKVKSTSAIDVDFFDTEWHADVLAGTGLTLLAVGPGYGGVNGSTNHFYGDNLRVRKYTANEPGISVGDEEAP